MPTSTSSQIKWLFLSLIFGLIFNNLHAQNADKNSLGTWFVLVGNAQISEKWSIPVTGILREYGMVNEIEFGFLKAGISYKALPKTKFSVGAAYLDRHPFEDDFSENVKNQFWLYQEVLHSTLPRFSQRLRCENRWMLNQNETIIKTRLRYRLQYTFLFNSKKNYIKCFEESFFSISDGRINQNRFFLGLGRKFTSNLKLEVGYMKNHVGKANYDRIRMVLLVNTRLFKQKTDLLANR